MGPLTGRTRARYLACRLAKVAQTRELMAWEFDIFTLPI